MAVVMAYVIDLRIQKGIKAAIYISLRINAATFLILLLFWLIPHFQLMRQVKSNASIMGGSKVSYSYSPTSRKESNEAAKAPKIPIHAAVSEGNIEAVKQHIAIGTDVNAKKSDDGWTPLHSAAMRSNKEIAELLIAAGADVNAKDHDGRDTPLDIAIIGNQNRIANLLRKHGGKTAEELKAEGK